MRLVRQHSTAPELAVRRALYSKGLRYRVRWPIAGVRSRPDIAFPGRNLAIYIDGCFWHGCENHGTQAKRNAEAWQTKIAANRDRDKRVVADLAGRGWLALRFCAGEDPKSVANKIANHLARKGT